MNALILACHLLPLVGMVLIIALGNTERRIATISLWCAHAMGASILVLLILWIVQAGANAHEFAWFTLYSHADYEFPIVFYLDRIGVTYLLAVSIVFSVIVRYCRYYLHREAGYKRFFVNIFAFAYGLNLVVLSGSIDLLFAGWEIVGIASFLLIGFYRHREQPIRNSLRAYTIYRFCDIGLLLGALMTHVLFHGSDNFSQLSELFNDQHLSAVRQVDIIFLALFILIAASGKSAQFPFCFWLPRAMEGPTPSSAIFYGALSIHLGVFLLLRTAPVWTHEVWARVLVILIGILTLTIASITEKTQSNIKGQVAYASISQVGIMFIELGFGLDGLVLIHFLGNAFFRCYQLLVSPSIVSHLLRIEGAVDTEFYIKDSRFKTVLPASIRDTVPEVLRNTLYVFSLQEGNLESLVRCVLWDPLKQIGTYINRAAATLSVTHTRTRDALVLLTIGIALFALPNTYLALPLALGTALCSLSAFSQKRSVLKRWVVMGSSCLFASMAVWCLNPQSWGDIAIYVLGILPAWFIGLGVLMTLSRGTRFNEDPFLYRGMAETKPLLSWIFFFSFLAIIGFPITPAFLGEDLLLFHASTANPLVAPLISVSFILNGIAGASIFLRLCMGQPAAESMER